MVEGICAPPGRFRREDGAVNSAKVIRISASLGLVLLAWPILVSSVPTASGAEYPETKAVLLEVHGRELQARSSYQAYAQKALEENYPNIAHLFTALAVSEAIHAGNMRELLAGLDVAVVDEEPSVKVYRTKKNLKKAAEVELREINKLYPSYIERITPEKYPPAIEALTHSWKAEKQHREHIERIKVTVDAFFKAMAEKIESTATSYYICEACGSTVREPPKDTCDICGGPALHVRMVPGIVPSP